MRHTGEPERYSPAVLATFARNPTAVGRGLLAGGLSILAGLLAAIGSWPGLAFALAQLGIAVAVVLRWRSMWPPAWAVLVLIPPPLAAARHWTVRLPGACQCARLAHPPPALVSLTGLAVLIDLALFALALALTVANRRAMVGKLSP